MQPGGRQPVEVFVSYAREDARLMKALDAHLSPIQRQGTMTAWSDLEILPGQEWRAEITDHLERASVILLLISAYFLKSDFCYGEEMKRALERHSAREARVIPVILRPSAWTESPVAKLQALPSNGKPVTQWQNKDAAFESIAEGVQDAIADFLGAGPAPELRSGGDGVEVRLSENPAPWSPRPGTTQTNPSTAAAAPERVYVGLSRLRDLEAQQARLDSYLHLYIELESSQRLPRARVLIPRIRQVGAPENGEVSDGFWEEVEAGLDQINPLGEPAWLRTLPEEFGEWAAKFDADLERAYLVLRNMMNPLQAVALDTAVQELLEALYGVHDGSKWLLDKSRQAAEECVTKIGDLVKNIIALVPPSEEVQPELRHDPAVLERYAAAITSTGRETGSGEQAAPTFGGGPGASGIERHRREAGHG
jgi:TIR domain